jgi:hypothetical protein
MGFGQQTPFTVPMPIIPEVQAMWPGLEDSFYFVWEGQLTPEEGGEKDKGPQKKWPGVQTAGSQSPACPLLPRRLL